MLGSFELSNTGALATSGEERDLGGGNTVTGAAFTVGEEAQLDARDRTDRGDSANYKGAPKTASGFRKFNDGSRMFSEGALAAGGQRPTWSEMTAPPRATMTDLDQDMIEIGGDARGWPAVLLRAGTSSPPRRVPNQNQYGIGTLPRPHRGHIVLPEPGRSRAATEDGYAEPLPPNGKRSYGREIEARVARDVCEDRQGSPPARPADYERALAKTAREAEDLGPAGEAGRQVRRIMAEETLLQLEAEVEYIGERAGRAAGPVDGSKSWNRKTYTDRQAKTAQTTCCSEGGRDERPSKTVRRPVHPGRPTLGSGNGSINTRPGHDWA